MSLNAPESRRIAPCLRAGSKIPRRHPEEIYSWSTSSKWTPEASKPTAAPAVAKQTGGETTGSGGLRVAQEKAGSAETLLWNLSSARFVAPRK